MAGGKETPRQKMIGLMYLVLTALLALQVSSSIIDKFIFLNYTIEQSVTNSEKGSEAAIKQLEDKIAAEKEKSGKVNKKGEESIRRSKELRAKVDAMIKKIQSLKMELITKAGDGIDPKTQAVKNPKEETKVEVMMVGPEGSKSGKAYTFEKEINAFVDELNREYKDVLSGQNIPYIAQGNKDKTLYKNAPPSERNKDYAKANFGQTPIVAALAVLSHHQSELLYYEQLILQKLGATDVEAGIKFDKLVAMASVESKVLAPGDKFKAKIFLSAAASNIKPLITFNGGAIPVKDGIGEVEQTVSGGGKSDTKVQWTASISFDGPDGPQKFDFKDEYTIVAPVLDIQYASAKFPLYVNCANRLVASVPALGANYNPSFGLAGPGRVIPGGKKGELTIVPSSVGDITLTVTSGGFSDSRKFVSQEVPAPTLALANAGGEQITNLGNGLPGGGNYSIKAFPDAGFAQALPEEANFRVVGGTLTVVRGGESVNKSAISGSFNPSSLGARKGDLVSIEVTDVQRASTQAGMVSVQLRSRSISFAIK